MAVIFGKNALSEKTIDVLLSYVEDTKKKFAWGSNFHMWQPNLTVTSGVVLTHALHGEMTDAIYRELEQRGTLPYYPSYRSMMFYSWFAGSSITWHSDYQDKNSMTVYLCKHWNPDDGGYFCWKEWNESFPRHTYDTPPDECHMRRPSFNDYVYMTDAEWHTTTITAPSAPPRLTLQMFFAKPPASSGLRRSMPEPMATIQASAGKGEGDSKMKEEEPVEQKIAVTLLLKDSYKYCVKLGAHDPSLTSLLEVVAKRNNEKTKATVFNLEMDDGESSLFFAASDLVALSTNPALSIDLQIESPKQPEDELIGFLGENWSQNGLIVPCHNPVGSALDMFSLRNAAKNDMIILHCPVELLRYGSTVVSRGGARVRSYLNSLLEPAANKDQLLIDFDLGRSMRAVEARIFDLGDVVFSYGYEPARAAGARCTKILTECFKRSAIPVLLGGDHSVTYSALEALNRVVPAFGVIHFDAHHDFYSSGEDHAPDLLTHANVFHFIRRLSGVRQILQIGLRDVYRPSPNAVPVKQGVLPTFISAREAARRRPDEIFASLDPDLPYYVTFDVDVLDSAIYQDTATPVRGGLSYDCAFELLHNVFTRARVAGLDIVEIGETDAPESRAAEFAARAILLLLFSLRDAGAISDYVFS
jgi:agmatinase